MALSSIGDLARSFTLRNQTTALKVNLDQRSTEVTTGRTVDAGRLLRGDFTQLAAIDSSLTQLEAFRASMAEASLSARTMQAALGTVSDLSIALGSSLLAVASPGDPASVNSLGQDADARFRTAVATLNARIGDHSLFAGVETRSPALASPDDLLDALAGAVAGAATAAEVEIAVSAWFADPAGFLAVGYLGGGASDPLAVASDESVQLATTAADPAIRDTLASLAMAALLDHGVLAGQSEQRAQLAQRAGERLFEGATGRTELAARIGTAQERIASAETRNAAEATAFAIARSEIVSVDGYEAASALTEAEAQLDMLYAITARLSRLSLAEYL